MKNLKIGLKISIMAGAILILLGVCLVWSITGLSTTVENGKKMSSGNELRGEILAREVDHLNWVGAVSKFLTDDKVTKLDVQMDHTKCALGRWLYGEGRKEAELLVSELKGDLKAMEDPHRLLHESAHKIQEAYRQADPALPQFLTEKKLDHVIWVSRVQGSLIAGERTLSVELDHTLCGFGKFLHGEGGRKAAAGNPELAHVLNNIKEPHQELHVHGQRLTELLAANDRAGAEDYFQANVISTLETTGALLDEAQQIATAALEGRKIANEIFATQTQNHLQDVKELMHSAVTTASQHILSDEQMIASAVTTRSGIIGIGGIALVLGLGLAFVITRSITGPIGKGIALAQEIAKGDFSMRLNMDRSDEIGILSKSLDEMAENLSRNADVAEQIADGNLNVEVQLASEKDQLGLALQTMVVNLNDILGQIQVAGEQIASGSGQVADSSQALSQGATESASSLEEISASLNQLSSQTGTNAENANTANQLSTEARNAAEQGSQKMQEMVAAMTEINDAGQSISKIIKVIDEIAFQTNLLALNAAVEAARAGQHGKGFAVVAEEVRNLAARSAKAAAETSELIEGSVQKTANGTAIAGQTAEALQSIVSGIGKVTDLVAEIAAASSEQAQGVSQINQGITQIDQVTQQNTASAEESAAASEELSGQAAQMREMLMRFTLKHGSSAHSNVRAVPQNPQRSQTSSGWGESPGQPAKKLAAKKAIALDDDEFGTY
ncbi:methyl-accepting chemotaxis protein [Pelovirga terrestris]|nr:methyl-accepting chemotaxis protein [Pelovirga terrestris]